ncbi:hypothetical protein IWX47DRAFT_840687 [Phyllosticta citricarpa]
MLPNDHPGAAQPCGTKFELSAQPGRLSRIKPLNIFLQFLSSFARLLFHRATPAALSHHLSDACHGVLVRIRQCRGHGAFLELASQIHLFSKDVEALQDPRAHAALDPDLTADLVELLKACKKKIEELEVLIEAQLPNADSNSFKRVAYAVRSLVKDRKLKENMDELATYQRIMTLHLARATWYNQKDILQLLLTLEKATPIRH